MIGASCIVRSRRPDESGIASNSYNEATEAGMKFTIVNTEAERREGLKALLRHIDRQARFNEAKDWRQAASAITRLDPDMIVIDWHDTMRMADLRSLLNGFPKIPAAIIVDEATTVQVRLLLGAGALGVVPRTLDPKLIVRALEMVLLGGHYIPARALDPAFDAVYEPRRGSGSKEFRKGSRRFNTLSQRQQQIMRCIHMGSTNKIIARTLGISEGTVKIHLASIFAQLGAPNRAAAVAIYNGWQNGYIEVLRREADAPPRPALGDAGPVPLRAAALLTYASRGDSDEHPFPIAAEPLIPFGE
jgi:DNA-binding NarL/FixJ family response regulator